MTQSGQPERRYFDIRYQYDLYGNLNQHEKSWQPQNQSTYRWARESFTYDLLYTYEANQVRSVEPVDNSPTQRYEHDLNGNLKRVYIDGGFGGHRSLLMAVTINVSFS